MVKFCTKIACEEYAFFYKRNENLTNELFRYDYTYKCKCLAAKDLFTIDDEGYLYFVSRMQQFIKRHEEKVSLIEIEKEIIESGIVSNALAVPIRERGEEDQCH